MFIIVFNNLNNDHILQICKLNVQILQPREVAKISKPKKFKSVPFQIPELSSKQKKNILTLPADKGSKLELLQKV